MSEKEISSKMQEIMNRMKTRREELNMSYQTLSEKVGISKSTLQRYETGYIKNMPVDKLEDIAKALCEHLVENTNVKRSIINLTDVEAARKEIEYFLDVLEENPNALWLLASNKKERRKSNEEDV